jgi:hypothetical protein
MIEVLKDNCCKNNLYSAQKETLRHWEASSLQYRRDSLEANVNINDM